MLFGDILSTVLNFVLYKPLHLTGNIYVIFNKTPQIIPFVMKVGTHSSTKATIK